MPNEAIRFPSGEMSVSPDVPRTLTKTKTRSSCYTAAGKSTNASYTANVTTARRQRQ